MIDLKELARIRADFKDIQAEENEGKVELCCMLFLVRYGEQLFDTIEALLNVAKAAKTVQAYYHGKIDETVGALSNLDSVLAALQERERGEP